MKENEKEYIEKINETLLKLNEVSREMSEITNKHGESIEILGRDLLPIFDNLRGEEIPAHTAHTIIVAYRELFSMYLDQNTEVMKTLMKQMQTSNNLMEFLTNKLGE